jgi:hypothetical protein
VCSSDLPSDHRVLAAAFPTPEEPKRTTLLLVTALVLHERRGGAAKLPPLW